MLLDLGHNIFSEQALADDGQRVVLFRDPELLSLLVDLDERVGELLLGRDLEVGEIRAVLVVRDLANLA